MIKKKIRLIKRFHEISLTLSKLGFYNAYEYFKLLFGLEVEVGAKPRKIREALEKLGPSFIKLGQVLSTRPDLVPNEIIEELIKLQDRAKPIEFDIIQEILKKNYGEDLKNIFAYIDPKPIASASIAQVHIGFLQTGEKVAIKIKRPNLEEIINLDADLLLAIASFLEKHSKTIRDIDLTGFIQEFKFVTLQEANFEIEANHIQIFRNNFKNHPYFYIPKCFSKISNKNILITEFIDGIKISEKEEIKSLGFCLKEIAEKLTDAYFKMVFIDGIYHADPHPGNLFLMYDGRIACIDFGMVGRLTKEKKKLLYEHIIAVTTLDINLAMNFYEGLGMITPKTKIDRFQTEIEIFLEKYHNKPLEKLDLKEMVLELLEIVKTNNLKLPTELAYLGKTTINLEGTVRTIYPEYNLTERLSKFIETSAMDYLKEKRDEIRNMLHIYYNAPFELQKLYKLILREKITINILFKEFENIQKLFEKQFNKLVIALLFIGLLISSGIFFIAEKEKYGEISLFFAVLFGLYSFYKLLKYKV